MNEKHRKPTDRKNTDFPEYPSYVSRERALSETHLLSGFSCESPAGAAGWTASLHTSQRPSNKHLIRDTVYFLIALSRILFCC